MKTTSNRDLLLHLSLLQGIGAATAISLIQSLGSKEQRFYHRDLWWQWACDIDLTQIYSFTVEDCQQVVGATPKAAHLVVEGLADKAWLAAELKLFEKHQDIRAITIFDDEYPELLRHIPFPPLVLYARGAKLVNNALRLAVVGARKCGRYAQDAIATLVPEFIAHDWDIVSGGALGVDTMAHTISVNSGGRTLVVLGSGLLNLYPTENYKLFDAVAANKGTLLSPFPLRFAPIPGNFPARNRIIAGLSLGTLVVQAAEKSGALITAHYALEQGRQVFAVPGLITDTLSAGCHALIKQGAKLVASVHDILEEFGTVSEKKVEVIQEKIIPMFDFPSFKPAVVVKEVQAIDMGHSLLQHMSFPRTLDELCAMTNQLPHQLQNDLFDLQLDGKVLQNYAGLWEVVKR
jgi:DNA processing protein